jgi:predicted GNAT family N-acyltransferase
MLIKPKKMTEIYIKLVKTEAEKKLCFAIRHEVFVEEQNVPDSIEYDNYEETALHYLCYLDEKSAGAARARILSANKAQIERLAVLKTARGHSLGKKIMEFIIADLETGHNIKEIQIAAQQYLEGFYKIMGFVAVSDVYVKAGIKHVDMVLGLKS